MTKHITVSALLFLFSLVANAQAIIPADSLKKHVFFLADDSLEGRGLSTPSGLKAAQYIACYFASAGLQPVGESYLHPFNFRSGQTMLTGNNVVGIIEGSDPGLKDEYILLGAHFDHISYKLANGNKIVYNGADDNASGTSAVIELGKALALKRDSLKRSIILVAFDGEESGLIGSGEFVKQKTVPTENIKLMMSIDMIGRHAESQSIVVGAMKSLKGGNDMLFPIAGRHSLVVKKTGKKISGRTDSKPFGQAGIPSLYISSGIVGPYHKPEDDASTIDFEGMEKIAGMICDLTVESANRESLEPIGKLSRMAKNGGMPFFRFGVKVNVGTSYHFYPEEFYTGKRKFSTEAGLITQFKLSGNFSLQPEMLYSTMAGQYNTGSLRTHSITTPVSLVVASRPGSMGQRFFLNLGGYYSYHFSGSAEDQAMDFDTRFGQSDKGLVFGAGIEVWPVIIAFNFKHGLSNLLQDESEGELKNRGVYFSLGYLLN